MKLFICRPGARNFRTPATVSPRAAMFLATLSPARRAAIAARQRFYRIPWLRRAGEAHSDPDDFLP